MKSTLYRMGAAGLTAAALMMGMGGCAARVEENVAEASETVEQTQTEQAQATEAQAETTQQAASNFEAVVATANVTTGGIIDTTDMFKDRDLEQTVDLSAATQVTLADGQDVQITSEGVYLISGEASECTIVVEAGDNDKVQLVFDGANITNSSFPAVYVKNADKVFVTTTEGSTNALAVTGSFVADGTTNTDAVIFSRDTLVLNGLGTLIVNSTANGIAGKDDIRITGGTYAITSVDDAIEANDAICICDGNITIESGKDALHAENSDDDTQGSIYICGGTFDITAASDALQATTALQIDGGTFTLNAAEGIEATYIQINGGTTSLVASDDGVNASWKSMNFGTPTIEITGGELTIQMGQGDTDAVDTNGDLIISGGQIDITAQFAFDFEEGTATWTGGTIYVNGEEITEITSSMMGGPGGMGGMMGGGPGGMGGPGGGMGGGPGGWG